MWQRREDLTIGSRNVALESLETSTRSLTQASIVLQRAALILAQAPVGEVSTLVQQGSSGVLASIQGSSYSFERQRCASEAARRQGVAGFSLAGFGTGESCEERAALMEATTAELPDILPRFLLAGAGEPIATFRTPLATPAAPPCQTTLLLAVVVSA